MRALYTVIYFRQAVSFPNSLPYAAVFKFTMATSMLLKASYYIAHMTFAPCCTQVRIRRRCCKQLPTVAMQVTGLCSGAQLRSWWIL